MGRPSRNGIISFDGFNPRNAVTHILYECPPIRPGSTWAVPACGEGSGASAGPGG